MQNHIEIRFSNGVLGTSNFKINGKGVMFSYSTVKCPELSGIIGTHVNLLHQIDFSPTVVTMWQIIIITFPHIG